MIALLPVIVVVVTRWGSDYLPVQDNAVMDLRIRDVWSSDIPLTGAYSRYGWSHPGPWMYWLIAPFSLVFGKAAWATLVGAALLQGAAVVWLARLSWCRGRLPMLALWLAIGALAYSGLGSWALLEAWNPHIAFPFFTLFLLQAWLLVTGDENRLIGAVITGSFLAQTHVGYVPLVVIPLAYSLISLRGELRSRDVRLRDTRAFRWSGLALLVLWLPVLIEPLVRPPGNLQNLTDFFTDGGSSEKAIGAAKAAGLLAAEFRVLPPWLGGGDLVDPVTRAASAFDLVWLLVPAVLIGLTGSVAWTRRDRRGVRSTIFVAVVVFTSLVTLTRITGIPFPYLFYWRLVVGSFTVLLCGWVLVTSAGLFRTRAVRSLVVGVLSALVAWGSIGLAVEVARHPRPITRYEPVTEQFIDELVEREHPRGRVLVRFLGSALGGVHAGIVDEMDRRGTPVFVDDGEPFAFGRDRVAVTGEVDELWYVVEDGHVLSLLTQRPGAEVLVRTDPLDAEEEAEIVDLQRRIARLLTEAGRASGIEILSTTRVAATLGDVPGVDPNDLRRLDELNELVAERGVCRCAVISFPASLPPQ